MGHHLVLAGHNIVNHVIVAGNFHALLPGFDPPQKIEKGGVIIGFREAFAVHEATFGQHRIGVEEAVGGHQVHAGSVGPAAQELLEQTRRRRFPYRNRPGNPDHKRRALFPQAQKIGSFAVEIADFLGVHLQQRGQRAVNCVRFG